MKPGARRSSIASHAAIERRIGGELGRSADGRFVAADRRTGRYVVADDLAELVDALDEAGLRGPRLYIFRVGRRAAVELRRR